MQMRNYDVHTTASYSICPSRTAVSSPDSTSMRCASVLSSALRADRITSPSQAPTSSSKSTTRNALGTYAGALEIRREFRRRVGFVSWWDRAKPCPRILPYIQTVRRYQQKEVDTVGFPAGKDVPPCELGPLDRGTHLALDLYDGGQPTMRIKKSQIGADTHLALPLRNGHWVDDAPIMMVWSRSPRSPQRRWGSGRQGCCRRRRARGGRAVSPPLPAGRRQSRRRRRPRRRPGPPA